MIKYGTADHIQKIAGKVAISNRELAKGELEKVASGKKRRKTVVTELDYRIEDREADLPGK